MIGIAGIGDVLLDLSKAIKPEASTSETNFYTAARKIAFLLCSVYVESDDVTGPLVDSYNTVGFKTEILNGINESYVLYDGMAGIVSFLSRIQKESNDLEFAGVVNNALQGLVADEVGAGGHWDLSTTLAGTLHSSYGFFYGMAGIGNEIISIGLRAYDAKVKADVINAKLFTNVTTIDITG